MRRLIFLTIAVIGTVVGVTPLLAHHGWSGYDAQKVVTLTGAMTRVDYRNPHVLIDLKAGEKTWNVVLAPSTRMSSRGLPEGALKVGATVSVVGYQHKTDANELRAERMTVAGKTIELR